jgi:raffinose/stachyose/melibiose transport system permease protein
MNKAETILNMPRNARKQTKINPLAVLGEAAMLCISACILFPFYYLVVNTIKTPKETAFNPLALPQDIYLVNFIKAFQQMEFLNSFKNSMVLTLASMILVIVLGSMAAYPIARRKRGIYRAIMLYFILGFMVPVQTTMVPLFLIMQKLQLVNKLYGMVILYSGGCTFAFFLFQGFIQTVPIELEESAIIDGCSVWRTFWKIVFPLLKPITTTIAIFHVMGTWNDFLMPFLFLHSRKNSTLTLEVYRGVGEFSNNWPVMLSTIVIVMLPLVIFYISAQKYIISGLTSGAIKG